MNNTNNRITLILALFLISVGILIWLTYGHKPKPTINIVESQETEVPLGARSNIIIDDYQPGSSLCSPRHTKVVEPMESTFQPTPNTCPYRE